MEWTLKMNGKSVTWKVSDAVATVPSEQVPPPSMDHFLESVGGDEDDDIDSGSDVGSRDLKVFAQAGWGFREPREPPPGIDPPDNTGGGSEEPLPDQEETRPIFITKKGRVLIGTDIATVQLRVPEETTEETARSILAQDNLTVVHTLCFAPHLYAVRLPADRPLIETINKLQANTERYVFAEPSLLQRISGREAPHDPRFVEQWQHASGPETGGQGLHSLAAWDITKGKRPDPDNRPVRIAIIDNGMNIKHADLEGAIIGGGFFKSDGVGTGTATFVSLPQGRDEFPPRRHGTFCMAMAGARQNDIGGSGIAPDSALIAIAFGLDLIGNQLVLARSIEFALNPRQVDPDSNLDTGADIISCSLGTPDHVETVLELAINSAASGRDGLGVPIFWAVENLPLPIEEDPVCSLPNVIAVGSSTRDGQPRGLCAFGPKLEFIAPGELVPGPLSDAVFMPVSGTSFATPLAAGVAALVMATHPEFTAQQVLQRLRDTCDIPEDHDVNTSGHGRLNAHRAVLEPA